jgi:Leucine-rich repeat (LRR) protein
MHDSMCMLRKEKAPVRPKIDRLLPEDTNIPQRDAQASPRLRVVIEISSNNDFQQGEIHNTTALDMAHNNFSQLPEPFIYPKLKELDCSHNVLSKIPAQLYASTFLKHLFFSHNRIGIIPKFIGHMKHLAVLIVAHNLISEIHPEIEQLKALTYFDASHNLLDKLPDSLTTLHQLRYLNLAQNPLPTACIMPLKTGLPNTVIEH